MLLPPMVVNESLQGPAMSHAVLLEPLYREDLRWRWIEFPKQPEIDPKGQKERNNTNECPNGTLVMSVAHVAACAVVESLGVDYV
jgi:hypothetical protein